MIMVIQDAGFKYLLGQYVHSSHSRLGIGLTLMTAKSTD
jgi:hypothetical protein